ncbi:pyridoxamine 5'-phosphate oxidase [Apibacter muscae]|uniref:Pyridoxine/pyridoxamine 5'-phosphate oxidase n=1 Tax=Apibacter muscae TaxID=2509004 RepID=A0A563D7U5_9FLAO|nr:pyridoxamine 5'-phosphate oxidase [Apibacter muscae]TWP22950.1 pyridoxamine 5'-phosphate oxidase [Apibacter muscae]TWP26167.1 pyridoxamine 5'-phosphate oxidase [Apibacter muscae]TWP28011.1 pyridoxamine 5'-phosphate oxidase [Apibacter muscae]
MEDLSNLRKIYNSGKLLELDLKDNPMELFRDWYLLAKSHDLILEPNAMSVSTIEDSKNPRTRMVLLKKFTWEGFIFFTNFESRKGTAIEENNNVCLNFYWDRLEKQIIINGCAERLSANLSDGYFHSRPRGSQLGAIVSQQSKVIPNREFLEEKLRVLEEETKSLNELERPNNWGGYLVRPKQIEFWQGRPNRLHDRILYTLLDNFEWKIERLAP